MYWTLELASKLEDAPWPATREELIDYATRSGAPLEVIENLEDLEEDGEVYDSIEDIWPDYPTKDDFFFDEEDLLSDGTWMTKPFESETIVLNRPYSLRAGEVIKYTLVLWLEGQDHECVDNIITSTFNLSFNFSKTD